MKQKRIAELYRFLSIASMKRMSDEEKVAFIRLLRSMKPLWQELQTAVDDALAKARQETDDPAAISNIVNQSVEDIAERECAVILATMSEDAFERLCLSNDWNFAQIEELHEELVTK